jgi:hypothetical protein
MSDTELLCIVVVLSAITQALTVYFGWLCYKRITEALLRVGDCRPGRARSGVVRRDREDV